MNAKSVKAISSPSPAKGSSRDMVGSKVIKSKRHTKVDITLPQVASAVLPGGYRVFGTPIAPKHTTRERIAEVIASLK